MGLDISDGSDFQNRKKPNPLAQQPTLRVASPDTVFGPQSRQTLQQRSYDQSAANYHPGQNSNLSIAAPITAPVATQQPISAAASSTPAIAGFAPGQAPIYRKGNSFSDNPNDGGTQVTTPGRGTLTVVHGDNLFTTLPGSSSQPQRPAIASYVGLDGREHADTRTAEDIASSRNGGGYNGGSLQLGESVGDQVIKRGEAEAGAKNLRSSIADYASRGFGRTAAELANSVESLARADAEPVTAQSRLIEANAAADPSLRQARIGELNASARRSVADADEYGARRGLTIAQTDETGARTDVARAQATTEQAKANALATYLSHPNDRQARETLLALEGKDVNDRNKYLLADQVIGSQDDGLGGTKPIIARVPFDIEKGTFITGNQQGAAAGKKPSLDEFIKAARADKRNEKATDADLKAYYQKKYGQQ